MRFMVVLVYIKQFNENSPANKQHNHNDIGGQREKRNVVVTYTA